MDAQSRLEQRFRMTRTPLAASETTGIKLPISQDYTQGGNRETHLALEARSASRELQGRLVARIYLRR
jgi:hypothetical protein